MYESESDEEIDFASLVVSAPSPHPTPVVDHPKPLNPAPFAFNSEEEGDEDAFEPRSVHTQKTLFDPSNPRGEGVHVRLTPGAARGVGGGGRGAGRGVRTAPNPSVILNRKSLSDSVPPNASALRDSAASNGSVSGTPKTRAPLVLNAFASPSMATFQDQRDHQADTTTASLSKPRSSAFHRKEDAQKKPSDSHISAALTALSPFETMPEREQMADKSMQKNVLRAVKNAYALVVVLEEMIANSSVLNEDRAKNEDGVMLDIDERRSFAKLCASIIATSPSTAAKYNLEGRLWKTTFHSCIESLRSNPPALPSPSARASWASLIATGVQTLTRLVYLLAAKPVEDLARLSPPSTPTYSRMIAWLGDLARYRVALGVEGVQVFLANGEGHACLKSWHNARKMYHIAAFLSPGNGQYYNHLALFDLTASETLSSLHNYLRALNVKAPFTGAHDSVLALFAGNRQVYQEAAKEETVRQSRVAKRSARSGTNKRGKETAAGAEEDVEVLVVRVFEALYTRVSLDKLPVHLKTLTTSLATNTLLPPAFYTQATVVLLSFLSSKVPQPEDPTTQLHHLILDTANTLLQSVVTFLLLPREGADAQDAQVALRLWCLWTAGTDATAWFSEAVALLRLHDTWSLLENYALNLSVSARQAAIEPVFLEEDWLYRGFTPLRDAYPRKLFDARVTESMLDVYVRVSSSAGDEEARVEALRRDLRVAMQNLRVFEANKETGVYQYVKPVLEELRIEHVKVHSTYTVSLELAEEAAGDAGCTDFEAQFDDNESPHLKDLKERKTHLSNKAAAHPPPSSSPRTTLRSLPKSTSTHLLFDTNCYISHCPAILETLHAGWTILLPLAVITELDGLTQGGRPEAAAALGALEPLCAVREGKPSNLHLVTYKGTRLPWLMVRTEDWAVNADVRGVDDVLLQVARGEGEGCVLVTGDVNLRLKARGAGVLTCSMEEVLREVVKRG